MRRITSEFLCNMVVTIPLTNYFAGRNYVYRNPGRIIIDWQMLILDVSSAPFLTINTKQCYFQPHSAVEFRMNRLLDLSGQAELLITPLSLTPTDIHTVMQMPQPPHSKPKDKTSTWCVVQVVLIPFV